MNALVARFSPLVVVLCAMALAGCSSVPVSTRYSLSQLDEKDIQNLDPKEVRAAFEVPDNVGIDPSKIRVVVTVISPSLKELGARDGVWPVEFVTSGRYVPLVISPADAGRKQYLYKLTPDAETHLAAAIADARAHPDPATKVNVDLYFDHAEIVPPGVKSIKVSAWLQLRRADGPLLLVEDRTINVDDPQKP